MHGHAAQLFRDIYFQKYKRKENGKCDIGSIYNDPTQKKSQLNQNSFYQHIDKINKHIKSYCSTVTWLGSSKFHPEDRGAEEEDNNNSSGKKTLSSDSKDLFHSVKKEWGKNLEINNDNNIEEHEAAQRQSKTLNNKESNKRLTRQSRWRPKLRVVAPSACLQTAKSVVSFISRQVLKAMFSLAKAKLKPGFFSQTSGGPLSV